MRVLQLIDQVTQLCFECFEFQLTGGNGGVLPRRETAVEIAAGLEISRRASQSVVLRIACTMVPVRLTKAHFKMRHLLENNLLIFQFNSAFDDFQSFDDLIHDGHCPLWLKTSG